MKPRVQAILLADNVYQDKLTGKYIVAGILDTFLLLGDDKPANATDYQVAGDGKDIVQRTGSPFAYINLTNFNGEFDFQLRYVSLRNNQELMSLGFRAKHYNPLSNIQLVFPVPSVPRIEDTLAFELLCDGEVIGSQRIVVTKPSEDFAVEDRNR